MEKRTTIEIEINGTEILHISSFKLIQKFNKHHEFELVINYDVVEQSGTHKLDQAQKWVGTILTASFDQGANNFKGIICEIGLSQNHGLRSNIVVRGYSTTILLDSVKQIRSFSAMTLEEIVQKIADPELSGFSSMIINNSFKDQILYQTQFKESNFDFINRLSSEYGQWFYNNGVDICFGKPRDLKSVHLVLGQNLSYLNSSLRVVPLQFSYYSYQSEEDNMLDEHTGSSVNISNHYVGTAVSGSMDIFPSKGNIPVKPRPANKSQLSRFIRDHQAGQAANLTDVTGESTNSALAIGSVADINVSLRDGLDSFKKEALDKYLITEITHQIDGLGRYSNTFKGIPADVSVVPADNVHSPQAESQVATVKDNKDPSNQGRVKVQMLWQKHNETTDWIRVLTPDAGSSNLVTQNRGYVFVPEIGDQVILGFRYNDPNRPFVLGSIFHGKTGAGGYEKNHLKQISTRSGHLIEFDDEEGTQGIKITDHHKNSILIDTKGNNITITALETMTFNAKNMQINVEENMQVNVMKDMNTQVSQNHKISVAKQSTLLAENITERATNDYKITAKKVEKTADHVNINSKVENLTLYSGKSVVSKSVEKNKLF